MLQDVALETAFPRSAIFRMSDVAMTDNEDEMSQLESGEEYSKDEGWSLIAGSRAEGLTLENDWGHENADVDQMWLRGGPLGVYVAGGQQPRGESCLEFRPEGCPPAYCKLQISDLHGLKGSILSVKTWFDDSCVEESDSMTWLNTYQAVRCMKDSVSDTRGEPVAGPAAQDGKCMDTVNTLVCSAPHPDLHQEFRSRTRGPWPTAALINYLLQLPMLLVLVGHKLSPEFDLQARMSWSHLECKLIKDLPESIRQGFIACKYVMKCFLKARRGHNEAGDGRGHIGSYHIKSMFLHFLEKRPLSLITSPFELFLDLLTHLDVYLQVGKLPHYFLPECDLLETVGNDERQLVREVIKEILSDPLNALLSSPTDPQQIYGEVRPDHLVAAFHEVFANPTSERCRDLFRLLIRVDDRRQERFSVQRQRDDDPGKFGNQKVSGRAELIKLAVLLKQITHI